VSGLLPLSACKASSAFAWSHTVDEGSDVRAVAADGVCVSPSRSPEIGKRPHVQHGHVGILVLRMSGRHALAAHRRFRVPAFDQHGAIGSEPQVILRIRERGEAAVSEVCDSTASLRLDVRPLLY
jgi:hypothetical protein